MRTIITFLICLIFTTNVNADYGGWIDMIVNSKEHKLCGDYARSKTTDKNIQTDYYYQCRYELEFSKGNK